MEGEKDCFESRYKEALGGEVPDGGRPRRGTRTRVRHGRRPTRMDPQGVGTSGTRRHLRGERGGTDMIERHLDPPRPLGGMRAKGALTFLKLLRPRKVSPVDGPDEVE